MRLLLAGVSAMTHRIINQLKSLKFIGFVDTIEVEITTLARVTERASIVLSGISILLEQNGTHYLDKNVCRDYHETVRLLSSLENRLDELKLLLEPPTPEEEIKSLRKRAHELLNKELLNYQTPLNKNQCYTLLEEKLCRISKSIRLKSRPLLQPRLQLNRSQY
jgi:hypothetical protein